MYSTCSGIDGGTLFQLRNVINRRNVVKDVKKDLNSCEEFMELITTAHILSAAMTVTEVEDLQALSTVILSSEDHLTALTSAAKKVCNQFCKVMFVMNLNLPPTQMIKCSNMLWKRYH